MSARASADAASVADGADRAAVAETGLGTVEGIARHYRGLIASGMLGAGERLPTVRQTAADLGVAPGTVAKAYKALEADGLVVTRTAAGTRVAPDAGVLPAAVVRSIRALVDDADEAGASLETVTAALRLLWRDRP